MTTASLLETLDQYEARFVADFMLPFSRIIIRATCPHGKMAITISGKITPFDMMRDAVANDHRDLCVLAHEWDNDGEIKFVGTMFICAAENGNRELCILAKEWSGAADIYVNFETLLIIATRNGDRDLCLLAMEWLEDRDWDDNVFSEMLAVAARNGDRDLCILAKEWIDVAGADTRFDEMLAGAADCEDPVRGWELCQLARKWMKEQI